MTDLERVVPCLVPASISHHEAWSGPKGQLVDGLAGVTWVIPGPDALTYVSSTRALEWEAAGQNWRRRSWDNLVARTAGVWTHTMDGADGAPFAVLLLHGDGLGPTRLAFHDDLHEVLGDGYLVCCPERTAAIAFRATLADAEQARVARFVRECAAEADAPFLTGPIEGARIALAIQVSCNLWQDD
jgi:hypothetical protein